MSGLGAIFHRTGVSVSSDSLKRMAGALRLYGPLKNNTRTYGNFGLCWSQAGHYTEDDKYDTQPVSAAGKWPLIFSGFLNHREELAAKLNVEPSKLRKMPDSSLIHMAWQKWHKRMTAHLHGQYAVIICDSEVNTLYAMRSRQSATPIYYHESRNRIVLGCAPKAIFALGDIPRELDEQKIADSLTNNFTETTSSYYRDIHAVPLGYCLTANSKSIGIEPIERNVTGTCNEKLSDENYVARASELFEASVASNMRGIKTPCATLSSGLDSSSVVVEALDYLKRRNFSERFITFTSVPAPGWDGRASGFRRAGDESAPVRALAQKYPQLDARFLDCAELALDSDLDKLILLSESPSVAINNIHWITNIYSNVRDEGRNICLTGVGGNRTLSVTGKSHYAGLARQGKFLALFHELRKSDNRGMKFWGLYKRAIMPNLPSQTVKKIAKLRGDLGHGGWQQFSAANPEYINDMSVTERGRLNDRDDSYRGFSDSKSRMEYMNEGGATDNSQPIRYALQSLTGVQARDPLADEKLENFCSSIPEEQFMKDGQDRRLIKRMMSDKLPPKILHAKRGRQAADSHMRVSRDLDRYKTEIERMGDDPDMAKRFDVPRLKSIADAWPEKRPLSPKDHPDYMVVNIGFMRAIATSRFINWVEGKN